MPGLTENNSERIYPRLFLIRLLVLLSRLMTGGSSEIRICYKQQNITLFSDFAASYAALKDNLFLILLKVSGVIPKYEAIIY
jgi:hypothetical protein